MSWERRHKIKGIAAGIEMAAQGPEPEKHLIEMYLAMARAVQLMCDEMDEFEGKAQAAGGRTS